MERLGIPGESAARRHWRAALHRTLQDFAGFKVGGQVVVIGGGNTAIDAANAARRLGAEEVHLFYRRSEREMPAFPFEYDRSKVEGVRFHWLAQPLEIIGGKGARRRSSSPKRAWALLTQAGAAGPFPCRVRI
jgi:dihydropyrimidine dehydrogenase (NAD+) subunit PreT